ncbi:hypothetical protein D3C87_145820 [compost metagenome]
MKLLMNERGDTFIMALVLLAAAGALFVGAQSVSESSLDRLNTYKARAQMNILEQRVRMAVNQPMAFVNCDSKDGIGTCDLDLTYLNAYSSNTGIGSEFKPKDWNLDRATRVVTVTLEYTGPYKIKNTNIAIKVPDELLQSQIFNCPAIDPNKPIFQGLDSATGGIICRELTRCLPGEYLNGMNKETGRSECLTIPSEPRGCAAHQMLSEWKWVGNDFKHNCKDRLDPFTYFGGP